MSENNNKKHVSFSQFSTYLSCPKQFYWDKVMGLKEFSDNINTCFGSSIHLVFQLYIKTLYTESLEKAEEIDCKTLFQEAFLNELTTKNIKYTEEDYNSYLTDGYNIILAFLHTPNRIKYFPAGKYEFIDVELKIDLPVKNNVDFVAYIDLVLKDKESGDVKIIDFKTSSLGWNKWQISDYKKLAQLLLYKALYSKKFNVPLNKIDIEFFIIKRKLYEDVSYPQSRIQTLVPQHNNKIIGEAMKDFIEFLDTCFTPTGNYIIEESTYKQNPGKSRKNCKYCSHAKVRCNQKQELID